jgi:hypothetical protein
VWDIPIQMNLDELDPWSIDPEVASSTRLTHLEASDKTFLRSVVFIGLIQWRTQHLYLVEDRVTHLEIRPETHTTGILATRVVWTA